jgi:hypothetical protein
MLSKRVEVLFDPKQYAGLEQEARRRGESVGSLVREAVERQYLLPSREERRTALKDLLSIKLDIGSWEEAKELILRSYLDRFQGDQVGCEAS